MEWIFVAILLLICNFSYETAKTTSRMYDELKARDNIVLFDLNRRQAEALEELNLKVSSIETELASFCDNTPFYKKPTLKIEAEELGNISTTLSQIARSVDLLEDLTIQIASSKS